MRGLARLLRRNPTEAERALWQALVNDRRFAGRGFKRQTPVGQHICDFVSFPLRLVIDLVPADESAAAARGARGTSAPGLPQRDYTASSRVPARRLSRPISRRVLVIGWALPQHRCRLSP